jgi:hypothetical protein
MGVIYLIWILGNLLREKEISPNIQRPIGNYKRKTLDYFK